MRLKLIKQLTKSNILVYTRVKPAFFFTLIFPLVFVGIFGLAFQTSDPTNSTIDIGILNHDTGIPSNLTAFNLYGETVSGHYYSNSYINLLESITFENNETKIFKITNYSNQVQAIEDLNKRRIKLLLVIEDDFSLGVLTSWRLVLESNNFNHTWENYPQKDFKTQVELRGDPSLVSFTIGVSVINEINRVFFSAGMNFENGVQTTIKPITDTQGLTQFDLIVPGLIIFAILSTLSTTASVALADVKYGQLDRLRLSKLQPREYLVAIIMAQLFISFLQIPILLLSSMIFGFRFSQTMFFSAYIFAMFVSFAISGLGILLAGLVKDQSAVVGLATMISTPMAFLAGAFFVVPNPTIISSGSIFGNNEFGLFDILPATTAISGLRLILVNNYTLMDVFFELIVTVILGLLYLAIGIVIYSRKHFRPN
jgi:ABC-2 type transport system permease protein